MVGYRAALTLIVAIPLAGCLVDIDYSGTRFRCQVTPDCPGGLECRDGVCTDQPVSAIDAAADAPEVLPDAPNLCGDGLCTEVCSTCEADCGVCPAGLVLRWTFDEPAGAAALDVSGNELDGVVNSAVRVPGLRGGALELDGRPDQVLLEPAPTALEPTGAVAIAAWIQSTIPASGEVASLGDSYAIRAVAGGEARIFVYNGTDWNFVDSVGAMIDDGDWHHLVGQFTGTALQIYVDGELAAELAHAIPIDYSLGDALVVGMHGNQSDSFDFIGLIDDVAIFDRPLDAGEIAGLAGR